MTLSGCKSAGNLNVPVIEAFDVLEQDSLMYMKIPVQAHKEFSRAFVASAVPQANDTIVNGIVNNIDTLYMGLATNTDKKRMQISASSSITASNLNLLSKNAGWSKGSVKTDAVTVYPVYSERQLELSQVCKDIIVLSNREVKPLIYTYDSEFKTALEGNTINEDWKASDIHEFVTDTVNDNIRFYMVKPLSLLTNLLGTSLSTTIFQLNFVRGEVEKLPNTKYAVTLELDFKQPNLVTRAAGFVTLALGLTNSQIVMETPTLMKITNIEVSMKQLESMLGISSKH